MTILDESERREPEFPHRRRQLQLLHSLGRRILQAHLDWIEEVEQEFGSPTGPARLSTSHHADHQSEAASAAGQ